MERGNDIGIDRRELLQFLKKRVLQGSSEVLTIASGFGLGVGVGELLTGTNEKRREDAKEDIVKAAGALIVAKKLESLAK